MRSTLILLLIGTTAHAGVRYSVTTHEHPTGAPGTSTTMQIFEQDGAVAVHTGSADSPTAIVFKDATIYSIDVPSMSADALTHATLDQVRQRLEEAVQKATDAASKVPSDKRAMAEQLAGNLKSSIDRQLSAAAPVFNPTGRSETVAGHHCRIWEATENGAKHLEVCVARTSNIPAGADILRAMEVLCHYYTGSLTALGVESAYADPWPAFARLDGVPIRTRVFIAGSLIRETVLTDSHARALPTSLFDVPTGYKIKYQDLK